MHDIYEMIRLFDRAS
jgi:hypothetical protein